MGKTSIVERLRIGAPRLGMQVVTASGHELEQQYPFGVARQLLAAVWRATTDTQHAALVEGVASLALPLVQDEAAGSGAISESQSLLYGTYWLLANLADRQPLVIAIDDAQWADAPSVELIEYLGRRVADIPVLLVVARRRPTRAAPAMLAPSCELVTLEPLSADGVRQVTSEILPNAGPGIAEACHAATGGTPLYVQAVLEELRARELPLEPASVDAVAGQGAQPVVRSVDRRLAALGDDAARVAEAVAILGDATALADIAELAGVDPTAAAHSVDALVDAGILDTANGPAFAHPVVRSAVLDRLGDQEVALRHRRAAMLELRRNAPAERVAEHVLRSPAGLVDGAAAVLQTAAAAASDRAAPGVAATLLARALEEPLDPAARFTVLYALGQAQAKASLPAAAQTLAEAAATAPDADERAAVLAARAMVLWRFARGREAAAELLAHLSDPNLSDATARWLRAELLILTDLDSPSREMLGEAVGDLVANLGPTDGPYGTVLMAHAAVERTLAYNDAHTTGEMAGNALGACLAAMMGVGDQRPVRQEVLAMLTAILDASERFEMVAQLFSGSLAMTAQTGDGMAHAFVGVNSIYSYLRCGALAEAEAVSRTVLALRAELPPWMAAWATAVVRLLYRELERSPDEGAARPEWDPLTTPREIAPSDPEWVRLLILRGELRVESGDLEGGITDLVEAGTALAALGFPAAGYHWQSTAALALVRLGRHDEARRHAREELELNMRWGAPRALGISRRTVALLADDEGARIDGLHTAIATLEESQAPLELARTLTELGAAMRRQNQRADARPILRRAIELADGCGADTRVASRARVELAACGGRAPKSERTGLAALTPSERRVVDLVATGLTNPQVAQQLFISRRTVETHLARSYAKLGIGGRGELAAALASAAD